MECIESLKTAEILMYGPKQDEIQSYPLLYSFCFSLPFLFCLVLTFLKIKGKYLFFFFLLQCPYNNFLSPIQVKLI